MRSSDEEKYFVMKDFYLTSFKTLKFSLLITEIVEIYSWLHNKLAHVITQDQARNMNINEVLKLYTRINEDEGNSIRRTYNNMFKNWNDYLSYTVNIYFFLIFLFFNYFCSLNLFLFLFFREA